MAKVTKKTTKRRVKKNVEHGQAHIQSSFNNTIVTLTVKGCRNISKKDMVFNDRTPELTVDPETYKVTVDGEEITSKPAEKLPLTQLYSLF